jgi:hypothetical protein
VRFVNSKFYADKFLAIGDSNCVGKKESYINWKVQAVENLDSINIDTLPLGHT